MPLPKRCSWCSETCDTAFSDTSELHTREGRKVHPLCESCKERGFAAQFYGKKDQTAQRQASNAAKSKQKQKRKRGSGLHGDADEEEGRGVDDAADGDSEDMDIADGDEDEDGDDDDMDEADDGDADALGDSEADDADRISWLDEVVVQSPDLITEAISKGYAPQLWTDEKGWEEDCGTCPNRGEAVECSFCSLVYHNTNECIGAKNIVSEHSMEVGAHWACPGCWKEMRETAERKLLLPAQKAKLVRVRRRRRPADAHA